MPPKNYLLLAYDFDGTLVDTKEDIALSVNLALVELGLPEREREEIYSFVGHGVLSLMKKALGESDRCDVDSAVNVFRKHYRVHALDRTRFYPECEDILDHFKTRLQAIVSNKPVEFVEMILAGLHRRDSFASVLGGDSVKQKKPDPEMVLRLLDQFTLPAQDVLMIGDSPQDISAGRSAGVATCGVTWGMRPRSEVENANPDFLIHTMSELKQLVL